MVHRVLTDTQLRSLGAREKTYTTTGIDGLAIRVLTSGARTWQFRYRLGGKNHRISFGIYPEVTLREARELCNDDCVLVIRGECPRVVRQVQAHHCYRVSGFTLSHSCNWPVEVGALTFQRGQCQQGLSEAACRVPLTSKVLS